MDTKNRLNHIQCFHNYMSRRNESWRRMPAGLDFDFNAPNVAISQDVSDQFVSSNGHVQQRSQTVDIKQSTVMKTALWTDEFLYHLFDQDEGMHVQLISDTDWHDDVGSGVRSLTRLLIPQGSSMVLNEQSVCNGCRRVEIVIEANATLVHSIQQSGFAGYDHLNIVLESGAKYHQVSAVKGAMRRTQRVTLADDAHAVIQFSAYIGQSAHWYELVKFDHHGVRSTSHHHVHSMVKGKIDVSSEVKIGPDAQYSESQQQIQHLLLCETAKIFSKPALDVYVDDVDCQHGAVSRMLDQNLLFYLYARGLNRYEASTLYVMGYLKDSIQTDVQFSDERYLFLSDVFEAMDE